MDDWCQNDERVQDGERSYHCKRDSKTKPVRFAAGQAQRSTAGPNEGSGRRRTAVAEPGFLRSRGPAGVGRFGRWP